MGEKLSTLELRQQAIIKELEIEVATLTRKFQEALLDDLTGLMKRKEITEAIRHSLNKGHLPTSLLFLDLNGFKEINDTKGHLIGDLFLIQFAKHALRRSEVG